jgi:hypothetical protein
VNLHHRDFTVGTAPSRKVSFSLEGQMFECLPDIAFGTMESYREGFIPNEEDPTKITIPVALSKQFIENCLTSEEDLASFRKLVAGLSFDSGADTIHAIRTYLIEAYSEAGPTTEPSASAPGPPVSGPSSTPASGSPE